MKKVFEQCDKCGQPTKYIDICDKCGQEIPTDSFDDLYLIIKRPLPDGDEEFDFQFCDIKCLTEWMQSRKLDKEYAPTSPYTWESESRRKFQQP